VLPGIVGTAERWVSLVSRATWGAIGLVPRAALALPLDAAATGTQTAATLVLGGVAALAALACYVELAARGLMLDLVAVIWPLSALGILVPMLRGLVRRSIEVLVGLVLLPVVMAAALGLGAGLARAGAGGRRRRRSSVPPLSSRHWPRRRSPSVSCQLRR